MYVSPLGPVTYSNECNFSILTSQKTACSEYLVNVKPFWCNQIHLDCALWANTGGAVIVDMRYVLAYGYERGAQQLAAKLCALEL